MSDERQRERELFEAALAIGSPQERRSFIERECGSATTLGQRVLDLLEINDSANHFFDAVQQQAKHCWEETKTSPLEGPGTMIGHYKLLELIGQGGFGLVYMAEQLEPVRRQVALKVLKLGMDSQEVIARFEAERQALAMINHPNVARVFDAGTTDSGRPYFVMELVPGRSITEYCDENRLTARERLELFIPVCLAVQHAHQKGIIHRDLKPSNILVVTQDGRPVPKIIDFGIAKAIEQPLTARTLFTRFGRMVGTPAYMSPEQSELSGLDVDTRSDIYSLGVVLYELLTGKPPLEPERLQKAALVEMQRIIQEEEPLRPSLRIDTLGDESRSVAERRRTDPQKLGHLLSGDLDWIIMKTLEKDRQRRYPTASALAEDIERHLHEQPVSAGPPRLSYRMRKFARRHRRTVVAVSLGLVFLWIGFLVATAGFLKARQERDRAISAEQHSERERGLALQEAQRARWREARERKLAYASDMSLAKAATDSGDLGRTLTLLRQHHPPAGQPDLREWEWCYLWKQCQSDAVATLYRHSNAIYQVSISPDGQELALGGFDGALLVMDLASRQLRSRLQDSGPPCQVQYLPRDMALAASDGQGRMRLWQTGPTIQSQVLQGPTNRVCAMTLSRDGSKLAAVEGSGRLWIWDVPSRSVQTNCQIFPFGYLHSRGLLFSDPPKQLWVGSLDGMVNSLDLATGKLLQPYQAHGGIITALALSPDKRHLASGAGFLESTIRVWDLANNVRRNELEGHRAWISALAYSPDGTLLASASADQTIRVWNTENHQLVHTLRGHLHEVWTLAFTPDGRMLVSGSKDGTVHLWRVKPRAHTRFPFILSDTLPPLVFTSPEGNSLIGRNKEGRLLRWDGVSIQEINPGITPFGQVDMLRGSAARGVVGVLTSDSNIQIVNATTLQSVAEIPLADQQEKSIDFIFSGNGQRLVLIIKGHHVRVIDTQTWRTSAEWRSGTNHIQSAEVSPDGALLASAGDQLRIWRLDDGCLTHVCQAHKQPTDRVAFSPDGQLLATASQEGSAKIWSVGEWQELAELRGHLLGVHCLAFSPNSQRLVTGSADQAAIKLWDLRTYREVLNLSLPMNYIASVGFSPDGNTLCAFGEEHHQFQCYLWSVPSLAEIDSVEQIVRK